MIDVHAHVQDLLAEDRPLGPLEQEHLEHCEACSAVADSLQALAGVFAELPQDEPPAALIAATVAAVQEQPDEPLLIPIPLWRRPRFAAVASVLFALLLSVPVLMTLQNGARELGMSPRALFETADAEIDTVDANLDSDTDRWRQSRRPAAADALPPAETYDGGWAGDEGIGGFGSRGGRMEPSEPAVQGMRRPTDLDGANFGDIFRPEVRRRIQTKRETKRDSGVNIVLPRRRDKRNRERGAKVEIQSSELNKKIAPSSGLLAPMSAPPPPTADSTTSVDRGPSPEPTPAPTAAASEGEHSERVRRLEKEVSEKGLLALIGTAGDGDDRPADASEDQLVLGAELVPEQDAGGLDDALALLDRTSGKARALARDKSKLGGKDGQAARAKNEFGYRADEGGALAWLRQNSELEGLRYKEAAGYWRNTYVPGDPVLRRVQSRLRQVDPEGLGLVASDGSLDLASRQVRQPFDRPLDSALAAYLHADRRGVDGPTRMRIQVGLQATKRRSGRRPTMNIAVVLDLSEPPTGADAASMRAFIEALSEARDLGDTFALVLAGRPGGIVLPPGEFRYGPVSLALRQAFGEDEDERPVMDLPEAFAAAVESVSAGDDPNAPLGSSAVLLVSARDLRGDLPTLTTIAHSSGVAGIPVSAIGVGETSEPRSLEAIALAGQGNRRVLRHANEARDLVQRELTAASRAVARAVRLRIRLAPGVKLVDVLGSQRLDEQRAEQIREAEKSIDVRLSRNLGIEADRGEDEEGIQIVVPAWYAGDAHVFVLDVVVPGPGPVADVTVRYKDLVRLNNGVARASLQLGRSPLPPGPLELNVLKNELARYLSDGLLEVAGDLRRRDAVGAAARLEQLDAFLRGMREAVPALRSDAETSRDLTLLAAYREAIRRAQRADARDYLRDSLFHAAGRKVLPPDAEETP